MISKIIRPIDGQTGEALKKGLVLEGGAMRGMFTCGIIDVMMENSITFDGIVGVSAGAAFGCNYISNQPGRALRYNMTYCRDKRYCGFRSLIKTGDIYGSEFCYNEIPMKLDPFDFNAFRSSNTEFHVVCTDVETGESVYHTCSAEDTDSEILDWIRASASMPLVSKIVSVGGRNMLDGGISDSVPLKYFQNIGYNKNIVILTRPADYTKSASKMMPLMRAALRKYPKLAESLAARHEMYNEEIRCVCEAEKSGNTLVLRPDEALPVKRVERDPQNLKKAYDIGREMCKRRIDDIRTFLR